MSFGTDVQRAGEQPVHGASEVEIRPFGSAADALAFRLLNEEWITRHFALEPKDVATLRDPEGAILHKGGRILMAELSGEPIGTVALISMGQETFELSKMAVSPRVRGRGIGRQLLFHAIALARTLGATRLFLGSSTKLPSAVHLYEAVGFRHVPEEQLPPLAYTRADVFMELQL
jgi:putative acetyltransferase